MGLKSLLLGIMWKELGKNLLFNIRDVITALVLTLAFGLSCGWTPLGYLLFFLLSLALVYVTVRVAKIVAILLTLRKMKKRVSGVLESVHSLAGPRK